jgi:Lar family restriction alleviation protein
MSINVKLNADKHPQDAATVKPCPFCGSTDIEAHCSGNYKGEVLEKPLWIECANCGACGPDTYSCYKDATEGWNNRINI